MFSIRTQVRELQLVVKACDYTAKQRAARSLHTGDFSVSVASCASQRWKFSTVRCSSRYPFKT